MEVPKPKRGRGRPPGTKNQAKKQKVSSTKAKQIIPSGGSSSLTATPSSASVITTPQGIPPPPLFHSMRQTNVVQEVYPKNFVSDISGAIKFLALVQNVTAGEPHLYQQFLELFENYQLKTIDMGVLSNEISTQFGAYPELMAWLNEYVFGNSIEAERNQNSSEYSVGIHDGTMVENALLMNNIGQTNIEYPSSQIYPNPNENQITWLRNAEQQASTTETVTYSVTDLGLLDKNNTNGLQTFDIHEAETLGDIALHALKLCLLLQKRFGSESQTYQTVTSTLSTLHEHGIKLDSNNEKSRMGDIQQLRLRAYQIIRDTLRNERDLMELVDAFFTSGRTYVNPEQLENVPSTSMTQAKVKDNPCPHTQVGWKRLSQEFVEKRSTENQTLQVPVEISGTAVEASNDWKEVDSTSPKFSIIAAVDARISSCIPQLKNVSTENKVYRYLYMQFDDGKCVTELTYALKSILMELSTLRSYMWQNHRALLYERNKDSDIGEVDHEEESDNLNSMRKVGILDSPQCLEESDDTESSFGSYRIRKDSSALPTCSGRTKLCDEVLNDVYYSVSHPKNFSVNLHPQKQERMDDYEDARFEFDMIMERCDSAIKVFENIKYKMFNMTKGQLDRFKLDENLGASSILHKQVVELFFKDDDGIVHRGLQECPALFVPAVFTILKIWSKEWMELRSRWNSLINSNINKMEGRKRRKKVGNVKSSLRRR